MVIRSILCIIALLLLFAAVPATSTPTQTLAQPAGSSILSLAVNPMTSRIYAAVDNSTLVIDGASNAVVATIPVSGHIVVNPNTNRIYVGVDHRQSGVVVLDGVTNNVITKFVYFAIM